MMWLVMTERCILLEIAFRAYLLRLYICDSFVTVWLDSELEMLRGKVILTAEFLLLFGAFAVGDRKLRVAVLVSSGILS